MGALLCIGVMFVMNWWTALITIGLIAGLFFYVHYRKPGEFIFADHKLLFTVTKAVQVGVKEYQLLLVRLV